MEFANNYKEVQWSRRWDKKIRVIQIFRSEKISSSCFNHWRTSLFIATWICTRPRQVPLSFANFFFRELPPNAVLLRFFALGALKGYMESARVVSRQNSTRLPFKKSIDRTRSCLKTPKLATRPLRVLEKWVSILRRRFYNKCTISELEDDVLR